MDFPRHPVESGNKQLMLLACGFLCNGTSTPTGFFGNMIESVAYAATGLFTVVLKAKYRGLDLFCRPMASLSMGTPSDSFVMVKAYDKAAGTITLATLTAGSAAAIAAAADNAISLLLIARYGSVDEGATYDA